MRGLLQPLIESAVAATRLCGKTQFAIIASCFFLLKTTTAEVDAGAVAATD